MKKLLILLTVFFFYFITPTFAQIEIKAKVINESEIEVRLENLTGKKSVECFLTYENEKTSQILEVGYSRRKFILKEEGGVEIINWKNLKPGIFYICVEYRDGNAISILSKKNEMQPLRLELKASSVSLKENNKEEVKKERSTEATPASSPAIQRDCNFFFKIDSLVKNEKYMITMYDVYFTTNDPNIEITWNIHQNGKVNKKLIWEKSYSPLKNQVLASGNQGEYVVEFKARKVGCIDEKTEFLPISVSIKTTTSTLFPDPKKVEKEGGEVKKDKLGFELEKVYTDPNVFSTIGHPINVYIATDENNVQGLLLEAPSQLKKEEIWQCQVFLSKKGEENKNQNPNFALRSKKEFEEISFLLDTTYSDLDWRETEVRVLTFSKDAKYKIWTIAKVGFPLHYKVEEYIPEQKKDPVPKPISPIQIQEEVVIQTSLPDWAVEPLDTNYANCDFCRTDHKFIVKNGLITTTFKPPKGEVWEYIWYRNNKGIPYLIGKGNTLKEKIAKESDANIYLIFKKGGWMCQKKLTK